MGTRLDRYLTTILHDLSRTAIQNLIAEGAILVNGQKSKPGYLLRQNDEIQVLRTIAPPSARDITPLALPLEVVYEDKDLLVINKESGLVVHPAAGHHDDTLVNALRALYPESAQEDFADETRPGIVHRLDRDTSGLLIIAKNAPTQAAMMEQIKQHQV
ncbi:MAG TPA: RluA family pseudouridine synthase, partial [Ktedonobacteraceae bacterium]|nr:RluA family pseudouridine synthase [Ktedonobacteraceae bacterium]